MGTVLAPRGEPRLELEAAVTGFIESISASGDYETLVAQADVAKQLLENARKAAE